MGNSRLSRIDTQWSVIRQAHDSQMDGLPARAVLVDLYGPAIRKYLLASLKDEDAANEVFQEFALKLVNGKFKNADAHKGKFRSLIKTTLYRLIVDHHRKKQRSNQLLGDQSCSNLAAPAHETDVDDAFTIAWRKTLLEESWNRLRQLEEQTHKLYYTVLDARSKNPLSSTRQLHESLRETHDAIGNYPSFRVLLHRARRRFSAIVLQLVSESLDSPNKDTIESELIELGLHHYCKPALNARK